MTSNLPTISDAGNTLKSFWDRKEGTTGMIILAFLGVGAVVTLNHMLPWINNFLGMAISAVGKMAVFAISGALLFVFLWVLFNPGFQALVKAIFKSTMRFLTGVFIEIDPIGIMKNYIDTLKNKKRTMEEKKAELRGQISQISQLINNNANQMSNSIDQIKAAQKIGKTSIITASSRAAGLFEDSNKKLTVTKSKMEMIYNTIAKYSEACDTIIIQMNTEVTVREQERKAMKAAFGAIRSAMSIMKGDKERELYDQALEYVVADYGQKLGEIEDFMDSTQTIMDGIDLQNGIWEDKALERLKTWEDSSSVVLGGEKRLLVEKASVNQNTLHIPSAVGVHSGTTDFDRFLK